MHRQRERGREGSTRGGRWRGRGRKRGREREREGAGGSLCVCARVCCDFPASAKTHTEQSHMRMHAHSGTCKRTPDWRMRACLHAETHRPAHAHTICKSSWRHACVKTPRCVLPFHVTDPASSSDAASSSANWGSLPTSCTASWSDDMPSACRTHPHTHDTAEDTHKVQLKIHADAASST